MKKIIARFLIIFFAITSLSTLSTTAHAATQAALMKQLIKLKEMEFQTKYLKRCNKWLKAQDKEDEEKPKKKDENPWYHEMLKETSALTKKIAPWVAPYAIVGGTGLIMTNNLLHWLHLAPRAYTPLDVFLSPSVLMMLFLLSYDSK